MKNQKIFLLFNTLLIILIVIAVGVAINILPSLKALYANIHDPARAIRMAGPFERALVVKSVDVESSSLIVEKKDNYPEFMDVMRIYITDRTEITRQDPIIEDGVIVGFGEEKKLELKDIAPGARTYMILTSLPEERIEVVKIRIGDPVPIP